MYAMGRLCMKIILLFLIFINFSAYGNSLDRLLQITGCNRNADYVFETQNNWMNYKVDINNHTLINNIKFHARELGYLDQKIPTKDNYDAVIILGAKYRTTLERMLFFKGVVLANKIKIKDTIYLLGSDRTLEPQECVFPDCQNKSETDALKYLAYILDLNHLGNLVYIDPHCNHTGKRCITDDTLIELVNIDLIKLKKYKTILVISNQPYLSYQDKVVKMFFKKNNIQADIETIGATAYSDINVTLILNAIAKDLYMQKQISTYEKP